MDPLTVKFKADFMRRVRMCPFLFQATWEYRSWSQEMKDDYQERIAIIMNSPDPIISAEAHIYALNQVLKTDEP